jgi:hypothetical protein
VRQLSDEDKIRTTLCEDGIERTSRLRHALLLQLYRYDFTIEELVLARKIIRVEIQATEEAKKERLQLMFKLIGQAPVDFDLSLNCAYEIAMEGHFDNGAYRRKRVSSAIAEEEFKSRKHMRTCLVRMSDSRHSKATTLTQRTELSVQVNRYINEQHGIHNDLLSIVASYLPEDTMWELAWMEYEQHLNDVAFLDETFNPQLWISSCPLDRLGYDHGSKFIPNSRDSKTLRRARKHLRGEFVWSERCGRKRVYDEISHA